MVSCIKKCISLYKFYIPLSTGRYSTGNLFNHPLLDAPEGFKALTQTTLKESEEIVTAITSNSNSSEKTLTLFDQLSDTLCRGADLAECIRLLHPDPVYVERAEECCAILGSYVEQLNTNQLLYDVLKNINFNGLNKASKMHAEILLRDFEISGVHLPAGKKEKFVELHKEILKLSHIFVSQCDLPICVKNPPKIIVDNKHLFHTSDDNSVYINSIPYSSSNGLLKEYCYKSYYSKSHPNMAVLDKLLKSRYELANLVGYDSFAKRTLVGSMAGTPEVVEEFLDTLNERIQPLARKEVNEIVAIGDDCDSIKPWNYPMLFKQVQQQVLKGSNNSISLSSCIEGLQHLFWSLFNVQFQSSHLLPGEVWHSSVSKFRFVQKGQHLGDLYCDWFNRDGKMPSDCQFTIQGGRRLNNNDYQLPISTLSLSLFFGNPPLMSPQSVQNVFHEMGHALHSILGRSPYQNTSGTRCSTDFAEVPSNVMELFLTDTKVLNTFAKDYITGQELSPRALIAFKYFSNLFPAFFAQEQILLSVMDQRFHGNMLSQTQSTIDIFSKLHDKYSIMEYIPDTAWYLRFTHLYTYAGKYYSYLWARSVANLIWNKCFRDDPFSRSKGELYESALLSVGGGGDPWDLVQNVLGYKPSIQDLVDAYYHELVTTKEQINKAMYL